MLMLLTYNFRMLEPLVSIFLVMKALPLSAFLLTAMEYAECLALSLLNAEPGRLPTGVGFQV